MKDIRGIFADNLKRAIAGTSITQADLAERIGVTPAAISQYVHGEFLPRADVIERMANYLDIPVDALYRDGDDNQEVIIKELRAQNAELKCVIRELETEVEKRKDPLSFMEYVAGSLKSCNVKSLSIEFK